MRINKLRWLNLHSMAEGDGGGGGDGGSGDGGAGGDNSAGDSGAPADNGAPGDEAAGGEPPVNYFKAAPEDWRKQVVAATGLQETDEQFDKRVKQLERVNDIGSLGKNYFEAQDRIRKGETSNGLPENATDEQMAAFREANGIPATPEEYKVKAKN